MAVTEDHFPTSQALGSKEFQLRLRFRGTEPESFDPLGLQGIGTSGKLVKPLLESVANVTVTENHCRNDKKN